MALSMILFLFLKIISVINNIKERGFWINFTRLFEFLSSYIPKIHMGNGSLFSNIVLNDLSADSSSRGLSSPCSAFEIGRQFYFPVWTDGCWLGDFPGSPVVKTWPSSVGAGCGFNPWSGS